MNPVMPPDAEHFPTTRWTLLQQLEGQPRGSPGSHAALQQLRELYWTPVLAAVEHIFPRAQYPKVDASQVGRDFFTYLTHVTVSSSVKQPGGNFRDCLKQQLLEFCKDQAVQFDLSTTAEQPDNDREDPSPARHHHACGSVIPADAPDGMCPSCLLQLALPSSDLPTEIGGFEIVDQIGQGGMAVVYEAYDPNKRVNIALKVMRRELCLDETELDLFRAGMRLAARLRHPNILPIEDGRGIRHEPPFFAMPLIEGGSLEDAANHRRYRTPDKAMRLMIEIANAVHCAHSNNVVHRDLKPGNVLIDAAGRSYVTDFGVAMLIRPGGDELPGAVVGTLGYMSPEHVRGKANAQADVYSLGAILYYLLTGRAPHRAANWQQLSEQFDNPASARPTPPRQLASAVSRDLEAVCLCALEPDATLRYRSAAELALDLQRVLNGEPPQPRNRTAPGLLQRCKYWCRRQPVLALGTVLGALLLLSVDVMMVQSVSSQALRITDISQEYNVDLAAEKANRVLVKLNEDARKLTRATLDPSIQGLLTLPRATSPARELIAGGSPASDTAFLVNPQGIIKAHWPGPQDLSYFYRNFSFRDYFRCALALHQQALAGVCLSRVFEADRRVNGQATTKFALSANVYAADGQWLGVFVATHDAASELKDIRITDSYSGQITSLLGPQDLPSGSKLTYDALPLTAVIHQQVQTNRIYPVDAQLSRTLQQRFPRAAPGHHFETMQAPPYRSDNYRDPVPGFTEPGLAGFAPVGRTGYVVAVYTPKSKALRTLEQLKQTQLLWTLILNGGLLLLISVGIATSLRRGDRKKESGETQ
jgi:serine/threonine protein kinase